MVTTPRILIIAGSDPSGGAGLQADLKTATRLGCYAGTAVTSLTVQNTKGVQAVEPVSPQLITAQIKAVLSDIGADAIKIGLLPSQDVIKAVFETLTDLAPDLPRVVDPVLVATSGGHLTVQDTRAAMLDYGVGGSILTPNFDEAAALTDILVQSRATMEQAGDRLIRRGADAVIVTGGHSSGDDCLDLLVTGLGAHEIKSKRVPTKNDHGTGCTYSTALACFLAKGHGLADAARRAKLVVLAGLRADPDLGAGRGPLGHHVMDLSALND
ncbi:MAG: bifunctional hydroxymethylpyrimidine kinase/phosphomethylpyrimidine kinase [Alphaproteobacteria bacterium]